MSIGPIILKYLNCSSSSQFKVPIRKIPTFRLQAFLRVMLISSLFKILFFIFNPISGFANISPEISREQKEILRMDLIQLIQMDVVVTSVSKKPQQLHKTASAIFVITQKDIRRTGAVNLMEALRIAPGVQVAKVSQNTYAISVRGFNSRSGADKLLVLIDGRSIYSIGDGGTFWIGQDVVLEDVDRIEVIRGPGAALWGSNAVNGVINIMTKNSIHTQGNLLAGGIGSEEKGFVTYRYGNKLENGMSYRIYGKYRDRDDGEKTDGSRAFDEKQMSQIGFRTDWQKNEKDHFTFQGDMYYLDSELDTPSIFVSTSQANAALLSGLVQKGANFLTRWSRILDKDSAFKFQFYYDRVTRDAGEIINNTNQKADLDFQYDIKIGEKHGISLGLNYRYQDYNYDGNVLLIETERSSLLGFFVHDEFTLVPDKWSFIIGTQIEHNEFSGIEFQPNIRTLWTPHPKHSFWAAVSRALKIPDPRNRDTILNIFSTGTNVLVQEQKAPDVDSEILLAYEAGYKFKQNTKFSFDVAAFYFDYNDLITLESRSNFVENGITIIPLQLTNNLNRSIYGIELTGQWNVLDNWQLAGSYSFAHMNIEQSQREPEHRIALRSYLDLPHQLQFDASYFYVSRYFSKDIPHYHRLDLRLGWSPSKNLDLSLVGQNLTDARHLELTEALEANSETQRSFYVKATLKF